jgi:outer membrane protein TolC
MRNWQKYSQRAIRFFGIACFCFLTSATGWVYADPRVLSLDEVIRKALDNSYELKIARVDVQISKTDVLTARSDYFPNIQARLNTEYLKDLDNTFRPVTSVGNTIIPSGTRFQNSMGLTLNQKITDFGARGQKVRMAKSEVRAKQAVYDQMLRDLKIKMIELYEDALTNYRSIKANEAILALAQQGYQMKKRLNAAGNTSAVDVVTEAIQFLHARSLQPC